MTRIPNGIALFAVYGYVELCTINIVCSDRILTCRIKSIAYAHLPKVGLVVIDLITSPVVSWRGCETPPQYRGSAVILCSTTVVRGPLSSWWPAVVVC